ncbi:ABC transporter substrate-binding protein [Hydrogenophaga sp. NFH-34]|uniref:ABC transporter substrate-binding protein n=1 Tax=Hydrogenophaga sp. NFH-34 TaxID=2744446 RepID=UPI001F390BAD|nr:ABC transporter substrate-binding protein [Hydrogenophaga sp. NFH-34]
MPLPASLNRRHLLTLASAATLPALAPALHARPATRLRFTLDWRIDGPGAIVLLTQARGYFADEGLNVVIDAGNGSAASVQRLAADTHDIGFADMGSLVEFRGTHPDAPAIDAIYMLMDRAPATVFALKSSGIRRPADLAGRKLGAPVFDAGRKTWPLFAQANGLAPDAVTWVNVDPALREMLLIKGDVDAITSFYYTGLLTLEARGVPAEDLVTFRYADHGVSLYGNAVVTRAAFAAAQPQAVAGFLRALNRGIKACVADPAAGIQAIRQRDPLLKADVEERRLRAFLDHFVATPAVRQAGLGGAVPARLASDVARISTAFGLPHPVDASKLFNPAFLPAQRERLL